MSCALIICVAMGVYYGVSPWGEHAVWARSSRKCEHAVWVRQVKLCDIDTSHNVVSFVKYIVLPYAW